MLGSSESAIFQDSGEHVQLTDTPGFS